MGCVASSERDRLEAIDRKLDELIEGRIEAIDRKINTLLEEGASPARGLQRGEPIPVNSQGSSSIIAARQGEGYDAFISHCKKIRSSEERAVWVADVLESRGLTPFFDRSDLVEITEEALWANMRSSDVCITVLDPVAFQSNWVLGENRLAFNEGIPIIPIYDADRYRWQQLEKWVAMHPWVFQRQTVPVSKDRRRASMDALLKAVANAKEEGRSHRRKSRMIQPDSLCPAYIPFKVGAGGSRETETSSAVESAHKAMLCKLSGRERPAVVVVTFTCTHDAQEVAARFRELAPEVPMIGCTTCRGIILNSAWVTYNKEFSVGMWCISDDGGTYTTVHIQDRSEGPGALKKQVMERVAKATTARRNQQPSFVVLLGSPGDEEIILQGIQAAVGVAVPIMGGSAADNAVAGEWRQIATEGVSSFASRSPTVSQNGIAVLVGWASCEIATTLTSGFRQTKHTGMVTEVDDSDHGRTIKRIDGKPAMEVYDRWTGGKLTQGLSYDGDKACVLAPSSFCPLAECFGTGATFYGRVMHPAFAHRSTGALTTFADAYEGMRITMVEAAPETLAKKISQSAKGLINQAAMDASRVPIELDDVVGALMIFCGGLVMAIDDEMPLAAEQLGEAVGHANVMGICCFGEQGMSHSRSAIHGNLMFGCLLFTNKSAQPAPLGAGPDEGFDPDEGRLSRLMAI